MVSVTMKILLMLIGLVALLVFAIAYAALNAFAVWLLMRHGPAAFRQASDSLRRFSRTQLSALSPLRIWVTVALQFSGAAAFFLFIREPLSLLTLASLLLGYAFFVSALTLSLLAQLPYVRSLWHDALVKLGLIALPIYFGFIAKGYANQWVGELSGASATNSGSALFAATAFLLCLVAAVLLFLAASLFELLLLFAPMVQSRRSHAKVGLSLLALCSFIGTWAAGEAVLQLPSSRLGNLLLSAVVFEFDAGPANFCDLTPHEKALAVRGEPFIKALYLSSSQERAVLLKRGPALFRPVVLRELKVGDKASYLQQVRVTDCFKPQPQPQPANGASAMK